MAQRYFHARSTPCRISHPILLGACCVNRYCRVYSCINKSSVHCRVCLSAASNRIAIIWAALSRTGATMALLITSSTSLSVPPPAVQSVPEKSANWSRERIQTHLAKISCGHLPNFLFFLAPSLPSLLNDTQGD